LWQPLDRLRHDYNLTVLGMLSPNSVAEANAINDRGDIVGVTYSPPDYVPVPTLWSTKDPSFVQTLNFGGHNGVANKINNFGAIVGEYWSDECPNGCAAAAQLQ